MKHSSLIWGGSAYYHDSAACLFRDGQIVAAAHFLHRNPPNTSNAATRIPYETAILREPGGHRVFEFAIELWPFLKERKKFLAAAHCHRPCPIRDAFGAHSGLSSSPFYIHIVLDDMGR